MTKMLLSYKIVQAQNNAVLVMTGNIKSLSYEKTYQELGLEYQRRGRDICASFIDFFNWLI